MVGEFERPIPRLFVGDFHYEVFKTAMSIQHIRTVSSSVIDYRIESRVL
jgi:hypothetical protein